VLRKKIVVPKYGVEFGIQTTDAHPGEVPVRIDDGLTFHLAFAEIIIKKACSFRTYLFTYRVHINKKYNNYWQISTAILDN
jgi:hypothetical protein